MQTEQNEKKAMFRRVAGAGLLCTAAWLGWWQAASRALAKSGQDQAVITINGEASTNRETPFACRLEKTLTKAQRAHKMLIALKMEYARIDTKEIADGYVFRFRPDAISFTEIADWVATERMCCPFFDLAVESERENGPLSLRITGREGVKQFIRTEFLILKLH